MACSSCGARIRKLAKQYPSKNVTPVSLSSSEKETKARLKAKAMFSVAVEEKSKYTETIEDLSTIHTV